MDTSTGVVLAAVTVAIAVIAIASSAKGGLAFRFLFITVQIVFAFYATLSFLRGDLTGALLSSIVLVVALVGSVIEFELRVIERALLTKREE